MDEDVLSHSQRKMTLTVSCILAAWVICWGPIMCFIFVVASAKLFDMEFELKENVPVSQSLMILSTLNSLLNSLLYFLTGADFQRALLEVFTFKACGRASTPIAPPAVPAGMATSQLQYTSLSKV